MTTRYRVHVEDAVETGPRIRDLDVGTCFEFEGEVWVKVGARDGGYRLSDFHWRPHHDADKRATRVFETVEITVR